MSIKGFSSQLKNIKAPKAHPKALTEQQFTTISPAGFDKYGLDVVLKAHYPVGGLAVTIDALQPTEDADRVLFVTGHGLRKGDVVSFATGSSLEGIESEVIDIPDANTIVLATKLPSNPVAGVDEIEVLRGVTLRTGSDGSLVATSGPIQYRKDGVATTVEEDTATPANNVFLPTMGSFVRDGVETKVNRDTTTPANNRPLPVEIISTSGTPVTFNITTGDIGVHTTHDGNAAAVFDSMRIGDGTNLAGVNGTNELLVSDGDTQTALGNLLTELQLKADLTETQPVSVASLPLPTGAATETTLANLLTELQLKADLTETQPVSLASQPLPTGAATETTLASLLTELQGKADLAETQPVSLASQPLPTGAATETTLANLLTELQLKADLTETQPVSAASLPLPTGAATEATLSAMSAKLPATLGQQTSANSLSVVMASDAKTEIDTDNVVAFARVDYGLSNVGQVSYTEVISDIGAVAGKKVIIFHASGTPLLLATGAAASEVDRMMIIPGGYNHPVELELTANSRLSVKAIGADVTSGQLIINVVG